MTDQFHEGWKEGIGQAIIEAENDAMEAPTTEVASLHRAFAAKLRKMIADAKMPPSWTSLQVGDLVDVRYDGEMHKVRVSALLPPDGVFFEPVSRYTIDRPEYGDVMTREDWLESVKDGSFIDDDGFGYAMRDDKADPTPLNPSGADKLPEDATHVVWFNK